MKKVLLPLGLCAVTAINASAAVIDDITTDAALIETDAGTAMGLGASIALLIFGGVVVLGALKRLAR